MGLPFGCTDGSFGFVLGKTTLYIYSRFFRRWLAVYITLHSSGFHAALLHLLDRLLPDEIPQSAVPVGCYFTSNVHKLICGQTVLLRLVAMAYDDGSFNRVGYIGQDGWSFRHGACRIIHY